MEIPCTTLHKQNRLRNGFGERVGVINEAPKALKSQDFWGLFSPFDSRVIAEVNFGFILFTPV